MSKSNRMAGRLADFISSSSPPNHHHTENATQRDLGELARRVEGLETALNAMLQEMQAAAEQPKTRQLLIETADDVFACEEGKHDG